MIARRRFTLVAGTIVIALALGMTAQQEVVFRAESSSMSPAVDSGDLVVAERAAGVVPERGDVVVFTDPGGWADRIATLTGFDAVAPTFVKRVVGLPGERVTCCDSDGLVRVDGLPMREEYRAEPGVLASVLAFDVAVPADSVFVLGDSRSSSVDSRDLGPVPLSAIVARLQFVIRMP